MDHSSKGKKQSDKPSAKGTTINALSTNTVLVRCWETPTDSGSWNFTKHTRDVTGMGESLLDSKEKKKKPKTWDVTKLDLFFVLKKILMITIKMCILTFLIRGENPHSLNKAAIREKWTILRSNHCNRLICWAGRPRRATHNNSWVWQTRTVCDWRQNSLQYNAIYNRQNEFSRKILRLKKKRGGGGANEQW